VKVDEPTPVSHLPDPSPPGQLVWEESEDDVEAAVFRPTTRLGTVNSSCGSGCAMASGNGTGMRGNTLPACMRRISMMAERERGCGVEAEGVGRVFELDALCYDPRTLIANKYRKVGGFSVVAHRDGGLVHQIFGSRERWNGQAG
jgi:hypothetical protein